MKMLLALLLGGSLYAGAILSVEPSPGQVTVGSSFQMHITVSGAPDLVGFQMDVLFPSFLTLTGVEEAGFFAENGTYWSPGTPGTGVLAGVFDVAGAPGIPDPDSLFTLFFTAAGPGSGEVLLGGILLVDSSFGDLPVDAVNAAAVTSSAVPEPGSWMLALTGVGLYWFSRCRSPRVPRRATAEKRPNSGPRCAG